MARKAQTNKERTSVIDEGVSVTPVPITEGETLTIKYDGLLAKNGATNVYAHLGYGDSHHWQEIEDIPMNYAKTAWTCEIIPKAERINFCFHDGANNWDNNNGRNWSLTIHNGK